MSVDVARWYAVHEFLCHEAALLDRRDYAAWLDLLAPDIWYSVTMPVARDAGAAPVALAVAEDDATALRARVAQISDPRLTRAESPPTLSRRLIGNLVVRATDVADEFEARCNILVHRCRPNMPEGAVYAGARTDVLRAMTGGYRLARRHVALDHAVLQGGAGALTILF